MGLIVAMTCINCYIDNYDIEWAKRSIRKVQDSASVFSILHNLILQLHVCRQLVIMHVGPEVIYFLNYFCVLYAFGQHMDIALAKRGSDVTERISDYNPLFLRIVWAI